MKKIVMTIMVVAMMITGALSVSAAAVDGEMVRNMDQATYFELRLAQIDEALTDGTIDADQAALLIAHVNDVALAGNFGNGSQFGLSDEVNDDCVLGEDGNIGLFSNGNADAGQRNGSGNGFAQKAQDGTQAGNGVGNQGAARGNRGNGAGLQLQDGSNGINR